tara:strand:+ start:197 stop:490 length:294 start_codon:yes stop_codon:yes gene_type:complete
MLLITLTILSLTSLFLGYKTIKNSKELKELKIKHRITSNFADKLAKKLLQTEKTARLRRVLDQKAEQKAANKSQQVEGEVKHKKTRRSKKRVTKKTV